MFWISNLEHNQNFQIMKTKKFKNLLLNKASISNLTSEKLTGGAPTTHKTNLTCGGICENSVIVCEQEK